MAVTQLLASISIDRLARCREDVGELDRLISFEFVPAERYAYLNWAPNGIEKALGSFGLDELTAMLERLFGTGAEIVNPDHPRGPDDTLVYEDITFVEPEFVRHLSSSLQSLNDVQLDAIFKDAETRFAPEPGTADGFFRELFDSLRDHATGLPTKQSSAANSAARQLKRTIPNISLSAVAT